MKNQNPIMSTQGSMLNAKLQPALGALELAGLILDGFHSLNCITNRVVASPVLFLCCISTGSAKFQKRSDDPFDVALRHAWRTSKDRARTSAEKVCCGKPEEGLSEK
jgi:hypothetical protein